MAANVSGTRNPALEALLDHGGRAPVETGVPDEMVTGGVCESRRASARGKPLPEGNVHAWRVLRRAARVACLVALGCLAGCSTASTNTAVIGGVLGGYEMGERRAAMQRGVPGTESSGWSKEASWSRPSRSVGATSSRFECRQGRIDLRGYRRPPGTGRATPQTCMQLPTAPCPPP